jgi:hypothetical protein
MGESGGEGAGGSRVTSEKPPHQCTQTNLAGSNQRGRGTFGAPVAQSPRSGGAEPPIVMGPAKKGHSCNQAPRAKGSGASHPARQQPHPTLGCQAAGRRSGPQVPVTSRQRLWLGMRTRRECRGGAQASPVLTSPGLLRAAWSREVSGAMPRTTRRSCGRV